MGGSMLFRISIYLVGVGLLGLSISCSSSSKAACINVSRPVLLGPILNLKGDKASDAQRVGTLHITTQDLATASSSEYSTQSVKVKEGAQKIDAAIETGIMFPNQHPKINEIYYGSWFYVFGGGYGQRSYVGIQGEIIHVKKGPKSE